MSTQDKVDLKLICPNHVIFEDKVDMVLLPGVSGELGVLPHHAPLISTLKAGVIQIYQAGQVTHSFQIEAGTAHISAETCTVLIESYKVAH